MADLEAWMRIGLPLESVLGEPDRTIDAWQSGGVKGLLVGPLRFDRRLPDAPPISALRKAGVSPLGDPNTVPGFSPNPTIYRRYGVVTPPDMSEGLAARWEAFGRFLDTAKRRNMQIYVIDPDDGMVGPDPVHAPLTSNDVGTMAPELDSGHLPADVNQRLLLDDAWRRAFLARVEDTLERVPQADGIILTRPSWGVMPGTDGPDDFLGPWPTMAASVAQQFGLDSERLAAAQDRLVVRLRKLTREAARLGAGGGAFATTAMLGNDPGITSWSTFRARTVSRFVLAVHDVTERLGKARGRDVKFGLSPRTPSIAPLAGYDFPGIATVCDMVVPTFGIHHRGEHGLYGFLALWVAALNAWSSSLWEAESFEAAGALLGLHLPGNEPGSAGRMLSLREFDRGYPDAFWREVIVPEARRTIAQADGYPWRSLPMIAGGRRPMGGDAIGVADFRRLLESIRDGGVKQVVHHNHAFLTAGEWSVLSEFSGTVWRAGSGSHGQYEPPDL